MLNKAKGKLISDSASLILGNGASTQLTFTSVGTSSGTLEVRVNGVTSRLTLSKDLTVTTGTVILVGDAAGSNLTLPASGTVATVGGALGTPSSLNLANATNLPVSTGISGLGSGVATFLATPSSANLASAVTGETGSGALVFANSPTLITPDLGTPSSVTLTNATGLPVSTGISGLGSGVATFLATPSSANLASAVTGETGSGALVFGTSPTLVTPTVTTSITGTAGLTVATQSNGDLALQPHGTGKVTVNRPLEVSGTSSYVKMPSLTTAQRDALTAADGQVIYNSDNTRYEAYKNGAWAELGSAASGGINFVTNPDAEGGIVTGVSSSNVTITAETGSSKIFGNQSFKGVSSSAGAYTQLAMNSISTFWNNNLFQATGQVNFTAIASGVTWRVGIYNTTDSSWLVSQDVTVAAKYDINLIGIVDTSKTYVFRVQSTAGTPSSDTFYFDNISFGPLSKAAGGVPVTEWASDTLTIASGGVTMSASSLYWRRVGDTMEVRGGFTASNTGTASSLQVQIPQSKTLVNSAVNTAIPNTGDNFGTALFWDRTGTDVVKGLIAVYNTTTSVAFLKTDSTARDAIDGDEFASTDEFSFHFRVPISEWAGETVSMANSRVEYASNSSTSAAADTTSFVYGPGGSFLPSSTFTNPYKKRVRFQTPIQDGDVLRIQINYGDGKWYDLVQQEYENGLQPFVYQNGLTYGIGLSKTNIDAYSFDVLLGRYFYASGATYGAAGQDWNATSGAWKWRVVKSSNPLGIGTGLATATTPGAYAAGMAPGATNGAAITAGYVGEVITASLSNVTITPTATAINVGSLSLTPGVWQVFAKSMWSASSGATTATAYRVSISTTSATEHLPSGTIVYSSSGIPDFYVAACPRVISTASSLTVYMVGLANYTGTAQPTDATKSQFYAVRIA